MASWAGGWFFLMAAEIFSVGPRNFRLPGLGAYLQEAANQGSFEAIAWGSGSPDPHHRHPGPVGVAATVGLVRTVYHIYGGRRYPAYLLVLRCLEEFPALAFPENFGAAAASGKHWMNGCPVHSRPQWRLKNRGANVAWVWYVLLLATCLGRGLRTLSGGQDALDSPPGKMGRYRPGHVHHPAAGHCRADYRLGMDHPGGRRHRQQPAPVFLAATGGADRGLAACHRAISGPAPPRLGNARRARCGRHSAHAAGHPVVSPV